MQTLVKTLSPGSRVLRVGVSVEIMVSIGASDGVSVGAEWVGVGVRVLPVPGRQAQVMLFTVEVPSGVGDKSSAVLIVWLLKKNCSHYDSGKDDSKSNFRVHGSSWRGKWS